MFEQTEYRLALILSESRQMLGIKSLGAAELPQVSVPKWERQVEQLTRLAERRWNIKTIVLDFLRDKSISTTCAVMEVRTASWQFASEGFQPIPPEQFSESSLGEEERNALLRLLSGDDTYIAPFSHIGWIDEAQQWIRQAVRDREVTFNSDILQLNTGGGFALVRFGTETGPAYWLKATGEPNTHEFAVTTTLAGLFPEFLPRIVAAREDWNAWITEDAGETLYRRATLPVFEQAVRCLTGLQMRSIDYVETLIGRGFLQQSISALQAHLDPLIDYLEEAMGRQTSTRVLPLTKSRLHELRSTLDCSCSMMIDLRIPDTVVHNDLNEGNILHDGSRCVFIDWAETFIGTPFLSLQAMCLLRSDDRKLPASWIDRLRAIYREGWLERLTGEQVNRAFALMPILALLSHLYGGGCWLESQRRDDSDFQAYTRSLARYMDRAANEPSLLEVLCR